MAAELNPATLLSRRCPPGVRFAPTDLELIYYYLMKKVNNQPLPFDEIYDVNLYQYNPETLAENYPKLGDKDWYFFTPREKKYKNGSRPDRAAGNGFWKATGADKPILLRNHTITTIGWKRALVFYQGKHPKGNKTDWMMYEFKVDQPSRNKRGGDGMRLDDWVLCRIYKKVNRTRENNQQAAEASPLEDSTPVDQNNTPEFTEADDPEVDNNENLAQIEDTVATLYTTEVGNNNNNHLGPIVIHDDYATQVAANGYDINGVPLVTSISEQADWIVQDLANFSIDPPSQNALPQNVPVASSHHMNFGFDGVTNPFPQPQNVPEPLFFDGEGWGIQKGYFQVQEGFLETQYATNPPQTGHSLFGPSTSNLSESKIGIQGFDKDGVTNSFAQPQNVSEPSSFDMAGCGFQEGDFQVREGFDKDGVTNSFAQPQNVSEPSSFDIAGCGFQEGDFQAREGFNWKTPYPTDPPQMRSSHLGPSTSNLSKPKIELEDYDKDGVTNPFAQTQDVSASSVLDIEGCDIQKGNFQIREGLWEILYPSDVPPQSGLSHFGPSSVNLSESEIKVEDCEKHGHGMKRIHHDS
ncbi:hypothetical protein CDL12_21516 [Handroanthus impetiginosus]|uniref:NAC domain-containing protein n=1 Tax=Handroanthus impetiginosus TaxID=429701 RepID=A0A2G9GL05_9LAMI|nr:hypothetical protein CDL12_21516 [Handroanthus impetiginosus]